MGIAVPATTPIEMVRGTTQVFKIVIKNQDKTPYILQAGEVIRFGVKEDLSQNTFVLKKEITSEESEDDGYILTIKPEDTLSLRCKKYFYDVGLQSNDDYYPIIPCNQFCLIPNITSFEPGDENG